MCGVGDVAVALRSGYSDDFLIKPEKAANGRGARDMGLGRSSVSSILEGAAEGRLSTLYVCGDDVLASAPELIERALSSAAHLIVQDVLPSALTERAEIVLPSLTFAEKSGTFTNHAGRVQAIHPAVEPRDGQPSDGEIFSRLLGLIGEGQWTFDPRRVLAEEIAANVPKYAGLTFDEIGAFGLAVDGASQAADH
jgi:predicted molibdopterin-dependent oxidoreductase YjgC